MTQRILDYQDRMGTVEKRLRVRSCTWGDQHQVERVPEGFDTPKSERCGDVKTKTSDVRVIVRKSWGNIKFIAFEETRIMKVEGKGLQEVWESRIASSFEGT